MNEVTTYDYAALGSLGPVIEGLAKRIHLRLKRTAEDIIEIGKTLNDAKALLKGQFRAWMRSEFDLSEDTAARFMRVAERFSDRPQIAETMSGSVTVLYMLADPKVSDAAVDAVLLAAEQDGSISVSAAREIIKENTIGTVCETEGVVVDESDRSYDPESDDCCLTARQPQSLADGLAQNNEREPTPPSAVAPVWREIERLIERASDLFTKHAQASDERRRASIALDDCRHAISDYIERIES